jgi:hypothetical protein
LTDLSAILTFAVVLWSHALRPIRHTAGPEGGQAARARSVLARVVAWPAEWQCTVGGGVLSLSYPDLRRNRGRLNESWAWYWGPNA